MLKFNLKFLALAALICNAPLTALTQEDGQRVAKCLEKHPILEAQLQEIKQKLAKQDELKDQYNKQAHALTAYDDSLTRQNQDLDTAIQAAAKEKTELNTETQTLLTALNAEGQTLAGQLAEAQAHHAQLEQRQLALDQENRTIDQINQANTMLNQELDQIALEIKDLSAGDDAVLNALDRLQQTTLPHTLIKVHQEGRQGLAEQMNKLRETLKRTS